MTQYIQEELTASIGGGNYQLPLYFDHPINIGENMHRLIERQRILIDEFYDTVVRLARKALFENEVPLLRILFSDYVGGMDLDYHRSLPDFCWRKPILFRTDQSVTGKIYELQPPGSGWGDIPLIATALCRIGCNLPSKIFAYTDDYSNNIVEATGKSQPKVCHMLDAASEPPGIRYLFNKTRPKLRYWGIDQEVSMDNIDYITAHSAASLTTSNYFNHYMGLANEGKLVFGISPNLIFDQKAIYLLPFYRYTKSEFSDEIRSMFPFTTFLEINESGAYGFYDTTGNFVDIETFCRLTKSKRRFFLKYGGTDLSRNWGSREVFRLDTGANDDCSDRLNKIKPLVQKGEIWIIQEDISRFMKETASCDINTIVSEDKRQKPHIKISAFYGSKSVIGVKVMARIHYKVHGQTDTLVGIGI